MDNPVRGLTLRWEDGKMVVREVLGKGGDENAQEELLDCLVHVPSCRRVDGRWVRAPHSTDTQRFSYPNPAPCADSGTTDPIVKGLP